jgi:hypothetical protein
MNVTEKKISDFFGPALRVLSDRSNLDAIVVWKLREDEGEVFLDLWPHPSQVISLVLPDDIEETEGRWTFSAEGTRWQFRAFPGAKEFAHAFKKAQRNRG